MQKLTLTLIYIIVIGGTTRSSSTCNSAQRQRLDQAEQSNHSQVVLNLLVTAPYPPSDGGWDGGIAVIPAVRLALRQINKHPDILPGYTLRAVENNSGCQVKPTASISLMRNVYYSQRNIVGMIGPGCSASAIQLAPILSRPEVSLIQIAPAATSPEIERLNQNTTFTMRAPLQMVDNTVDLLKRSNWTRYAILYDPSRNIFKTLHDVILLETKNNNISASFDSIVMDDKNQDNKNQDNVDEFFPLEDLKASRSRIIILLVERRTVQRIMCIAYNMRMIYPFYQWILLEKSLDELVVELEPFEAHGINYNCSKEQMVTALNGSIITEYGLNRTNGTIITPLNTSYKEYRELYNEELFCHLNESTVQKLIEASNKSKDHFIRGDYWENPYYDAAWVFGLALHEVAKKVNLANYRYGQENITRAILNEFNNIRFEGASSFIQFTPTRNVLSSIITSNLTSENGSELRSNYLCSHNGSGCVSCLNRYTAIDDSFEEVLERMHVSAGVIIIFVTMAIGIFTVSLHILFVKYREKKSVKATSPTLSHLIFSGCYLYCIASVISVLLQVLPFKNAALLYSIFCNIVMWCVIIGASLIFGTVLVKIWRIFRLFRHFSNERPGLFLSNQSLIFGVLFLVAVDVIFCAFWSNFDPYIMAVRPLKVVDPGAEVDTIKMIVQCKCNNIYIWIGIVLGLKGPIIIILMIFATLNRQIKRKHFSHTKKVNMLVYSLTIFCGAGFPLFFILLELSDSVYVSLIFCFILLASVIVCCVLLFIPPLRHLDDRAVKDTTTTRSTFSRLSFKRTIINSPH